MIDITQLKQRTKNIETVSCKVSTELKAWLDAMATTYNVSVSDIVRALLTQFKESWEKSKD